MTSPDAKSPWLIGAIVPILVALISSPYIYQAIKRQNPAASGSTVIVDPPVAAPIENGPTTTWAGDWVCTSPDHSMNLTIVGKGRESLLKAYYPVAFQGQPATEEYTVSTLAASTAAGEYLYYDTSANVGYQGHKGVWNGEWSMTVRDDRITLTRRDHTSGWVGEYDCRRR